jgi:lysophospholipase L1-like esterase
MKSFFGKRATPHFYSLSGLISGLAVLLIFTAEPISKMHSSKTFLSLGDSYTIGESVLSSDNFPNQTVRLLREAGYDFHDPEIIAKTGWTTDELQGAIDKCHFKNAFDFVSLLVGVNNQYRGRSVGEYKSQFETLVKQAIQLANQKADHVIVLSIPDWGVTPFAKSRDNSDSYRQKIAGEIDAYNKANREIAETYNVTYFDITPGTRDAANDLSLIASDGLHPSAKEYAKWSEKIYHVIQRQLQ